MNMRQWVLQYTLDELTSLDIAAHFSDTFWALNETEHGTDAPDRLGAFGELLAHPDRTPELDRQLLMPFLVRYVWEVAYPTYTAAAWHHLCRMVNNDDGGELMGLTELALDILDEHPHGALRAEVLRWDCDHLWSWCEHLWQAPGLPQRLARLLTDDPAPAVRMAVIRGLGLMNPTPREQVGVSLELLLERLQHDPAAEVRETLFEYLSQSFKTGEASSQVEASLLAALSVSGNQAVLPTMLRDFAREYLSGLLGKPDRVAALFNILSANADSPRWSDMRQALGSLEPGMGHRDSEAAALWLSHAPYASGEALVQCAQALFDDPVGDLAQRAHALSLLSRLGQPVDAAVIEAFLLAPAQTAAALDDAAGAHRLIDALLGWPRAPGGRLDLYRRLMAHLRSRPDLGGDADHGQQYAKRITDRCVRLTLLGAGSQPLLDELIATVRDWPFDIGFALYDLGRADTDLDLQGLLDLALRGRCHGARCFAAGLLAKRLDLADARALALLLELLRTSREVDVASEAFSELPKRHALDADWAARLTQAVVWVHDIQPEEHDHVLNYALYRIRNWCE